MIVGKKGRRLQGSVPHPLRVGNNLRVIREVLGFTQTQVAQVIGTQESVISYWEKGIFLSEEVVELLADVYNVKKEFIFTDLVDQIRTNIAGDGKDFDPNSKRKKKRAKPWNKIGFGIYIRPKKRVSIQREEKGLDYKSPYFSNGKGIKYESGKRPFQEQEPLFKPEDLGDRNSRNEDGVSVPQGSCGSETQSSIESSPAPGKWKFSDRHPQQGQRTDS